MHVFNQTSSRMYDLIKDDLYSYSVLGVEGKVSTCGYVGYTNLTLEAYHWDDGQMYHVTLQGNRENEANAVLCEESPLSLVSWSHLKKAGWKILEDGDGIFHRKYRMTIYLMDEGGLTYMPVVEEEESETASEKHGSVASNKQIYSLLSDKTKYGDSLGGSDILRSHKAGRSRASATRGRMYVCTTDSW